MLIGTLTIANSVIPVCADEIKYPINFTRAKEIALENSVNIKVPLISNNILLPINNEVPVLSPVTRTPLFTTSVAKDSINPRRSLSPKEIEILRNLFNAEEYMEMYPEVERLIKLNNSKSARKDTDKMLKDALFNHFINIGIWENKQPSESFSVVAYASAYNDLRIAFGNDIISYYTHYYNSTVIGNEKRTITTVKKAQDAGIKVTDFSGNTVAVNKSGEIVTGAEADKIVIELNLASQINTQLTPIVTTTNIKKEVEKKEVGNSFNKNEPVAPVIKKTFAKAYKEWLADEPVGGSGNVYMVWYAKEPNLADYADGRAFLAKKEAWEKEMPDYDAYLAKTAYASDYEAWQAKEPKLADYTILVGTDTAEEKYNEDFAKWQELTPKPEDYIKYTSFETDYNAWLAAAPVPVEGKYETAEKAMEAYNKAHSAWETNMPKQSDYFDEEGYNKAVTEWTNKAPKKENYHNYEGYLIDFESWKNKEPKQETYIDTEKYSLAKDMHENEEPVWEDYFKQEEYTLAQAEYKEYSEKLEAYENYITAQAAYEAEKAKYDAYKAWEGKQEFEYGSEITVKYYFISVYFETEADAIRAREEIYGSVPGYEIELPDIEKHYFYKEQGFTDENAALKAAKEGSKPTDLPSDTKNAPVAPEVVDAPGEPVQNPDENQIDYLMDLAKEGNATDRASAKELFDKAYADWKADEPKPENFLDTSSYNIDLERWENNQPNEGDYFNNEDYASMENAKAAYDEVLEAAGPKPKEEDFFGDKAKEANITDRESALKAYEKDKASYTTENPEPVASDYTSQVIDAEKKAAYDKAVEEYNASKPSETDNKYVEAAKATEEYKEAVAKHEADKPNESNYVDDVYATETDATNAFNEAHQNWENTAPAQDSYIAETNYAEDLGAWEESEPDFNEEFGIEASE